MWNLHVLKNGRLMHLVHMLMSVTLPIFIDSLLKQISLVIKQKKHVKAASFWILNVKNAREISLEIEI